MEAISLDVMAYVEIGGLFAPILFICFHLLRPFFFIPVVFICIAGGLMFGPVVGSIYSLIGVTISSILFYGIYCKMPKTLNGIFRIKDRILGERSELTKSQIIVLRLIPFIHFHLLSLCLIQITTGIREYARASILSNIPLAFIYTSIGGSLSNLSPLSVTIIMLLLLPFLYLLRKKAIIIKWKDFFPVASNTN